MRLVIRGWRHLGLGVEMDWFRDQWVEIGRFIGGVGWVYGSGGGDW